MVNMFNIAVAFFRLSLALIMLFVGIILLILNPKIVIGSNIMPIAIYIGTLLLISSFVLGVISIESKPVPGPPGPPGPDPDADCVCKQCSNFKVASIEEDVIEYIQKSTLKDL